MSNSGSVLVLGDSEGRLAELASRIRSLGFSVLRAKTAQDATATADKRGTRFRAIVIEPDTPAADLRAALDSLRRHPSSNAVSVLAVGTEPGNEELASGMALRFEDASSGQIALVRSAVENCALAAQL